MAIEEKHKLDPITLKTTNQIIILEMTSLMIEI